MQVDFTRIRLKDIDGNVAMSTNFHKTIADRLYNYAKTCDFVEIAMEINKGNSVDLSAKQIEAVRSLIKDPQMGVYTHSRKAFDDFVDEILATEAQRLKDEKNKPKVVAEPKEFPDTPDAPDAPDAPE